ncbi:MAG TPA: hypothetical protein DDY77_02415 [Clostridiales bacterium]|nr:hypothetical protein [Clostridiales bacterium]
MKYCTHCGKQLMDEAVICPGCGCAVEDLTKRKGTDSSNSQNETLGLIAKVFMIIACVVSGFLLIPLCWTIPMTLSVSDKLKNKEPISVAMKVCTLIFVSTVSGVLLLCMNDDN